MHARMDFTALSIVAAFFAVSWGLTRLCERLQDGRSSS
jgi:hypothetical protein